MAEEKPTLHIDTDWKKQAQEEKRRLADQQAAAKAAKPIAAPPSAGAFAAPAKPGATAAATAAGARSRASQEASFSSLVQSILTQIYYFLGELDPRGGGNVNLDMAKLQLDTLNVLEAKTVHNLDEAEQRLLDNALYEGRVRYVAVASQYL
jgi:hypothetical protein